MQPGQIVRKRVAARTACLIKKNAARTAIPIHMLMSVGKSNAFSNDDSKIVQDNLIPVTSVLVKKLVGIKCIEDNIAARANI